MKRAILLVSPELLVEAMRLPSSVRIVDARASAFRPGVIELAIEHDSLPAVRDGDALPQVTAVFVRHYDASGESVEFKGFK